jgi:hypothetical protein
MKISVKKKYRFRFDYFFADIYQPARNLDYGQVLPTHFNKIYAVPSDVESIYEPLVMIVTVITQNIRNSTFNPRESFWIIILRKEKKT